MLYFLYIKSCFKFWVITF